MTISASLALLALLVAAPAQGSTSAACDLTPEMRAELGSSANVADPFDFDANVAPMLALRQRHPQDLRVHEIYQDAVQRYGIEGHLRKLTEDYQVLSMQHPDELMYEFLYARSLIGRNTPSAIRAITKLLADHPDFAPGHRSLAEIYASAAFWNGEKENIERERFLKQCPGSELQERPEALPEPSRLVEQAERLLDSNGSPDRVAMMAEQGIRDDEWRLQRIRSFDWYTVEFKRRTQRDLQAKYWKMWSIEVRCDRRAGRTEKAAETLTAMDKRAKSLAVHSDPIYWEALTTLVRLYEEGNQRESAARNLGSMQQFLAQHPDPQRAAQLETLRKQIAGK